MGNPLFGPVRCTDDGTPAVPLNNRFSAYHAGVSGELFPALEYKFLITHSKNYGRYSPPFETGVNIGSPSLFRGGLAMRRLGMTARFYALITALGLAFQPGGLKKKALTGLVTRLYRWVLFRADKVIFQNQDDRQVFVSRKIVDVRRCVVVSGSGVNLDHFVVTPLPQGNVVFLTIACLLGDKGLREYAQAAKIVKEQYPIAIFHPVGPTDPSPDAIPLSEVQTWQASGALQYLGATKDVRPFIGQCHTYVLPSYHEGMPRTVLEAMAMCRLAITTNVPGCRETVVDGYNGFLVPVKDALALARAMEQFILHPELIEKMGRRSREIAEERFDVNKVNDDMLRIMRLI